MTAPLHGYRVLDLTDERGLLAGRMLADLGADVVQIEPAGGSPARAASPVSASGSYVWDTYAANKRGIVADPGTDAGRELIRELAQQADFFIESLGPGVAAGLGLGWEQLRELNPALVYGTLTAFGHDGPKSGYRDADLVVWAAGGPLQPNRDGDLPPLRISVPQAYLNAAADLAGGLLLAHHARVRTGRGQRVDVSAQACLGLDTLGRVLADSVRDANPEWAAIVSPMKRTDQSGSGSGTSSHLKKWTCIDGLVEFHLAMGAAAGGFTNNFFRWMHDEGKCSDRVAAWDWRALPKLVESGEFDGDDMDEVRAAVEAFLAGKTKDEILQAAIAYRLLCIGISDTHDLADSPQLAARDFFDTVGDGERSRTMPARWAHGTIDVTRLHRPAPLLDEHTDEVRREWLADRPSASETVADPTRLPLAGLKVADFSWVVAGPVVGRALADFGATVVRVESSRRVETARMMQPFYDGVAGSENSALYGTCNAGKLGVSLDLATDEGREVARDIARWADVVVESFSPGQVRKWGLDYDTLRADNPSVIMLSTSLMGQTGPSAKLAGYGNIGASMSGLPGPRRLAGPIPDRPVRPVHRLRRAALLAGRVAGGARPPAAHRRRLLPRRRTERDRGVLLVAAARRLFRPRHHRSPPRQRRRAIRAARCLPVPAGRRHGPVRGRGRVRRLAVARPGEPARHARTARRAAPRQRRRAARACRRARRAGRGLDGRAHG